MYLFRAMSKNWRALGKVVYQSRFERGYDILKKAAEKEALLNGIAWD